MKDSFVMYQGAPAISLIITNIMEGLNMMLLIVDGLKGSQICISYNHTSCIMAL